MSALSLQPTAIQWGLVIGASLVAVVTDARARRIPNALTGPLFCAGLLLAAMLGGLAAMGEAALAAALLALPYVLLFVFAGGGAGDAKLMGAIGACLGLRAGATTLTCVCLMGIVLAVAWAHHKRSLRGSLINVHAFAIGVIQPLLGQGKMRDAIDHLPPPDAGEKMPYGLAICAGVLLAAGWTAL